MRLLDMIKIELAPIHKEKIELIDDFDFSKTAKKVAVDTGINDKSYLDDGVENLKRYYVVALLDPLNKHAVSETVDPFWHAHILHTRDYIKFCEDIFGQYVQHEPLDLDDTAETEEVADLYEYTVDIYEKIFKSVDYNWWPKLGDPIKVGPLAIRGSSPIAQKRS